MHREANLIYRSDRRHQHTMLQTYKCLHGLAPERVSNQITIVNNAHTMSSRSKSNGELAHPHCKLETAKRAFRYRAPSLWSMIDEEIKAKPSVASFKHALAKSDMFDVIG